MTEEEENYVAILEQCIIDEKPTRWLLTIAFLALFLLLLLVYLRFLFPVSGDNWTPEVLSQCPTSSPRSSLSLSHC